MSPAGFVLVTAALAATLCCGCSGRACTAIGAPPDGVDVVLPAAMTAAPTPRATVCIDGTCRSGAEGFGWGRLYVPHPGVSAPGPVVITAAVTSGTVTALATTTTTVVPVHPNGEGCEPQSRQVTVTATLRPPTPSALPTG